MTDSREDTVAYADEEDYKPRRSQGRTILAAVLVVIAILLIIAAVIYYNTEARSLPSILGQIKFTGHNHARAYSPRTLRGTISLVVGLVALAAGVFAFFWKPRKR